MRSVRTLFLWGTAAFFVLRPGTSAAQTNPDAGVPTVKISGLIFTDYTYTQSPTSVDANGNTIHPNAFNVTRAYLNFTGNLSHNIEYRVTADINKETSATSSNNGSDVFRLKYAYGQLDLDSSLGKGSWVKLGVQTTPWLVDDEDVYRYRFQGPTFADAEGYLTASDFGLSGHYELPDNYGDVHVGFYNGDGFNHSEANDQKALQGRLTVRPAPAMAGLKGLRLNVFYDADHYVSSDKRDRFVGGLDYESRFFNFGTYYLDAKDQQSAVSPLVEGKGYTVWANPRTPIGVEALIRYDSLKPDTRVAARKKRFIGGIAYWFPVHKGVATALMADYTNVKYDSLLNKPNEKRYALHTMFSF